MSKERTKSSCVRYVLCLTLWCISVVAFAGSGASEPVPALSSGTDISGPAIGAGGVLARFKQLETVSYALHDNESRSISVKDFGAVGNGIADDTAAINAAITAANGKLLLFPAGTYLTKAGFSIPAGYSFDIQFIKGASIKAGAKNITIFLAATNWYNSKITDAVIDGNGLTGVTAFDLSNFRAGGSSLIRPKIYNVENGIIYRTLCWSTYLDNPYIYNTTAPIVVMDGGNNLQIRYPNIDKFGAIGIDIKSFPTYPTVGVEVIGGYIQGGGEGVRDAAFATKVTGTYFERCSIADVSLVSGSHFFSGQSTNHTSIGAVAYKGRNADAAYISHPFMSSGGRTTGLFDFDGSNTNCVADYIVGAGSANMPRGVTLGISQTVPKMQSGEFTPIVAGTSTAGVGTYEFQVGHYTQVGNVVYFDLAIEWTKHTGTGNLLIAGLPFAGLTGQHGVFFVVGSGLPSAGGLYAIPLNATDISIMSTAVGGKEGAVPMEAAATIRISGSLLIN